jgi:thioredoxin reductase (NADPH)
VSEAERDDARLDLLVVGAGPTGLALGAAARAEALSVLLVERGGLVASLLDYPVDMTFFTTRERLEIAGVPFAIPEDKPNRRQAIAYYQAVAARHQIPLALQEEVVAIEAEAGSFRVRTSGRAGDRVRRARAVAVATGYFTWPRRLGVPGEDLTWVRSRYREPWEHYGEEVVVVGAGNSAAEAALDLFRHGARVTVVHRGERVKETIKYWVKPDLENRIEEGSIGVRFGARVVRFSSSGVEIEAGGTASTLAAGAAYVLIGYRPATALLERAGVVVDAESAVPRFDPATGETDVPGLYVAGTVQAGRETHRIFIENSREHGIQVVAHLAARLRAGL